MRRLALAIAATLVVACLAAAPCRAATAPVVGIADQSAAIFPNAWWQELGLRDVRVLVSWDVLRRPWERAYLDDYMSAARRSGARVLISFGRSRSEYKKRVLPSTTRFAHEFSAIRARYPEVRDYLTWNEANHAGQPTAKHPEQAARYYNAIKRRCRSCRIVAADVLDTSNMVGWLKRFRKVAKGRRPIWGVHNYVDANRNRSRGTRALLKTVKTGDVWFTETGGLVVRRNGSRIAFPGSIPHAARATRQVFRLARLSSRIKRIYLYDLLPSTDVLPSWDSALLGDDGRPRPAYGVLKHWLRAHPPAVPLTIPAA